MQQESNMARIRSTTVLLVTRNGQTSMAGDGQVTLGETVLKSNARKVRRISNGKILAGFCRIDSGCILAAHAVRNKA